MARNPLYNNGRVDAQNNGLQHDNKATEPVKNYRQGMNTFNNSYRHATTERFADVSPFMALDLVERDKVPFRSTHKLASYTLKSPMMDEIYKHKFYSIVPYKAILPNTWELFYVNPTKGDDIPDDAYCNFDIVGRWRWMYDGFVDYLELGEDGLDDDKISRIVEFFIATESIFSTGSLLAKLKYNFWPYLYKNKSTNFDVFFDNTLTTLFGSVILEREIQVGRFERVAISQRQGVQRVVSLHTLLDYLRNGEYTNIQGLTSSQVYDKLDSFTSFVGQFLPESWNTYDVDLSRVIAYQITCISQVTDASIDYLFNAQLFRNVLFPLQSPAVFTWNGQPVLYDTFSKAMFTEIWFSKANFSSTCQKLFSYAKSLKFGDYFTQMRPQPYAVGDRNLNIGIGVDVVEVTRKIVYQRFLNWSNRVGPKYEDYIKSLTGMDALPDPTEPALITHSRGTVSGFEVENTGEAQLTEKNSVTTLLRDTGSSFEFNIVVSEPSILLGLTSYDMPRLYTRLMDRANLKENRFDFFNHMMQYIGDQEVKAIELDASQNPNRNIGYTTRDMQYKMQVDQASGGFVFALPSWGFTSEDSDNDKSLAYGINPEFIRNLNQDFDRFFSSLTGNSLGTYFHFILKYKNDFSEMERAMDVAPDIL